MTLNNYCKKCNVDPYVLDFPSWKLDVKKKTSKNKKTKQNTTKNNTKNELTNKEKHNQTKNEL